MGVCRGTALGLKHHGAHWEYVVARKMLSLGALPTLDHCMAAELKSGLDRFPTMYGGEYARGFRT